MILDRLKDELKQWSAWWLIFKDTFVNEKRSLNKFLRLADRRPK